MEQPTQAEALRLAEALDHSTSPWNGERVMFAEAAAELRRLHAELESLRGSQQAEPAGDALDAARLDFMIAERAYVVSDETACDGYWLHWARPDGTTWVQGDEHATPRAAIDSAIASQQP